MNRLIYAAALFCGSCAPAYAETTEFGLMEGERDSVEYHRDSDYSARVVYRNAAAQSSVSASTDFEDYGGLHCGISIHVEPGPKPETATLICTGGLWVVDQERAEVMDGDSYTFNILLQAF